MGIFDFLNPKNETHDERARRHAAQRESASAMNLYKQQQEMSNKAIGEKKEQQDRERKAINEHQIRTLRSSYRRPSIMASSAPQQSNPESVTGI